MVHWTPTLYTRSFPQKVSIFSLRVIMVILHHLRCILLLTLAPFLPPTFINYYWLYHNDAGTRILPIISVIQSTSIMVELCCVLLHGTKLGASIKVSEVFWSVVGPCVTVLRHFRELQILRQTRRRACRKCGHIEVRRTSSQEAILWEHQKKAAFTIRVHVARGASPSETDNSTWRCRSCDPGTVTAYRAINHEANFIT